LKKTKKRLFVAALCLVTASGIIVICALNPGVINFTILNKPSVNTDSATNTDSITELNKPSVNTDSITDITKGSVPGVKSAIHGYGVSTNSKIATKIGMTVLENGGNAVDAAIAVAYTLGTVAPDTCGVGGGGGMLVYNPENNEYKFFNYYSSAPTSSEYSKVAVPGFVAGMEEVWKTYGTKSMKELLQPSVDYAENGFVISEFGARSFNSNPAVSRTYLNFDSSPAVLSGGEWLTQPQLAVTLRKIQENGADAFYHGEIAQGICDITTLKMDDFSDYKVTVEEAVTGSFYSYNIASAPPPFSGITLIQMLEAFELTDIPNPKDNEVRYLDLLKSISEETHADRIKNICDPRFSKISNDDLTNKNYVSELVGIDRSNYYSEEEEHESTTHIAVIDKNGMVVSSTNTLSSFYGSEVFSQGFFLNNSTSTFSSGINAYEKGKRPRTFISPTIIQGEDGFVMSIGSPGGNRIVKVLTPIILDSLIFEADLQKSINKNRAVFTGKNTLTLENSPDREAPFLTGALNKYYVVSKISDSFFGSVQAVGYSNTKKMFGGADPRRDGLIEVKNIN